jgi:exodeoxyribonuclease VII small subunit
MGVVENNTNKIEVESWSCEEAVLELEEIVGNLEQGANKLDDAIEAYERGTLLKKHCERKLSEAKARIEKITVGSNGNPTAEPVDL